MLTQPSMILVIAALALLARSWCPRFRRSLVCVALTFPLCHSTLSSHQVFSPVSWSFHSNSFIQSLLSLRPLVLLGLASAFSPSITFDRSCRIIQALALPPLLASLTSSFSVSSDFIPSRASVLARLGSLLQESFSMVCYIRFTSGASLHCA